MPEHVGATVVPRHDKPASRIDGDVVRVEWAFAIVRREVEVKRTILMENLNAGISSVSHNDSAVKCDGYAVRILKLAAGQTA